MVLVVSPATAVQNVSPVQLFVLRILTRRGALCMVSRYIREVRS